MEHLKLPASCLGAGTKTSSVPRMCGQHQARKFYSAASNSWAKICSLATSTFHQATGSKSRLLISSIFFFSFSPSQRLDTGWSLTTQPDPFSHGSFRQAKTLQGLQTVSKAFGGSKPFFSSQLAIYEQRIGNPSHLSFAQGPVWTNSSRLSFRLPVTRVVWEPRPPRSSSLPFSRSHHSFPPAREKPPKSRPIRKLTPVVNLSKLEYWLQFALLQPVRHHNSSIVC
ncbi:hypothetical protein BDP55DRAFT_75702 [Colletotrichum godetiae]|uniref:Uncharacterized protein n=1 Tax=Colletotrichum godetiae TaxID=1209918 RepID=A0AAJ0EXV3_9PEZI|nr:uncharacterized protein BDP55DRAFT_75702 [Colletotrichum godetiae]KAK1688031.1 hypothetical protein BDP55DRAFT_75702 [Colletotrichum godetiae]